MTALPEVADVVLAGAGPAASSCAAFLARAGIAPLMLERETFPRFHIGESLLPRTIPTLRRLGISTEGFVRKDGAEFIDERSGHSAHFPFADTLEGVHPHAYQVERADFDQRLMARAQCLGANVIPQTTVLDWTVHDSHVDVQTDRGSVRTRYFIDATGQRALSAKREQKFKRIDGLGRAARFRHFHGLKPAVQEELLESGSIRVLMLNNGWAWVIPLNGHVSVGLVSQKGRLEPDALDALCAESPLLTKWLHGTTAGPARTTGSFSFVNTSPYSPRVAAIGDAACFLDPIFSSGVALGVEAGEHLAGTLAEALRRGTEAEPEVHATLSAKMRRAYQVIGALAHRFYHTQMVNNLFFAEKRNPAFVRGLTTVLALEVWRDDNPFQKALEKSSRRLVDIPMPSA